MTPQAQIAARRARAAADAGFAVPEGMTPSDLGTCRSCGARVLWVITAAFRRMPVDQDGVSHFATCPQADRWRRPR